MDLLLRARRFGSKDSKIFIPNLTDGYVSRIEKKAVEKLQAEFKKRE